MINIKDKIVEQLEKVVDSLSDTYPQNFNDFPAVSYCEEENCVYEVTDEGEASSLIRIRIDIWSNKSTSSTAVAIDEVIARFGFKRISCSDIGEPSGMKHKMMRYEAIVDTNKIFAYHKN